jgi:uncharacterized protein (TIGR01777 family)
MFRDTQISGPFARWEHTHRVEPDGERACFLEDRIEYALPLEGFGAALGSGYARRKLQRAFDYRHRVTAGDIAAHARWSGSPLRVLVSGSRGLVGSALVPYLTAGGHSVARLVRFSSGQRAGLNVGEEIVWDPTSGETASRDSLEGFDAVVHLAGENIAGGKWTPAKKALIRESRVADTKVLVETLARLRRPPHVLVAASAIGFYGDRGDEVLTETSTRGTGFLADVCNGWEAAARGATAAGMRVINVRTGVVLSMAGGALKQMLPPFRMGAGGRVGSGRQWMSWIALDDLLDVILHALLDDALAGPVNAVGPQPVINRDWTRALGRVLHRPTIAPLPAFAVRAAFGEMGQELLLASQRVLPERLLAAGHAFRYSAVESALRHVLGRELAWSASPKRAGS